MDSANLTAISLLGGYKFPILVFIIVMELSNIPYSGKLEGENFCEFRGFGASAKVFSAKIDGHTH